MAKAHSKAKTTAGGGGQDIVANAPDTAAMVAELAARYVVAEPRQPGDVDSTQMARAWGCSRANASTRLSSQPDLVKLRVRDAGTFLWVWRRN